MPPIVPPRDAPAHAFSPSRWWLVLLLTLLFMLSFVDRNGMRLLIEPIRADLGVGDVKMSILVGLAFSALYTICCIPMGHLADMVSRRTLLAVAVAAWSAMAVLCGLSATFTMLALARGGLGIGEAALQPCATSLIRDSFPVDRRARIFAFYNTGPFVGSALANLAGGGLFAFALRGGTHGIPIMGALHPWQFALVVPGLFGLLMAALTLTVREPRRQSGRAGSTFAATFGYIRANWRLYLPIVAAPTLWSLGNTGWLSWIAAAIGRQRGMSPAQFGPTAGLIALLCATGGAVAMGLWLDRYAKAGRRDAMLVVTAIVQLVHLVPAVAMFSVASTQAMWICYGLSMALTGTTAAVSLTLLTEITPPMLLGKTVALYNLVLNFLGLSLGPTLFALVGSTFFGGMTGIIPAICLSYPVALVASSTILLGFIGERRRAAAAGHPAYS